MTPEEMKQAVDEVFTRTIESMGERVIDETVQRIRVEKIQDPTLIGNMLEVGNELAQRFAELSLAIREDRVIIIPTEVRP